VQHLAFDFFVWKEMYQAKALAHIFFQHTFPNVKVLIVTLPSHLPGIGDERVSDRRYKLFELDDLMIKAGSALKRHCQFLAVTFNAARKSYPAFSVPVMKTALHVKEGEYKNIPEEDRFTCVCPPLESEIAPTARHVGVVIQNTD